MGSGSGGEWGGVVAAIIACLVVNSDYDVVVIGGGHAGAEAAWASANLGARTLLVTMDPSKIGTMSCNPAIGGLAKGQIVREVDALGGLMGLATDATGIQFRVLNASKGPAVRGPRAQADKYRYAREVHRMLASREAITILGGTVERFQVEGGRVVGVVGALSAGRPGDGETSGTLAIQAPSVVLTTVTFMGGLLHTGVRRSPGGRVGERSAVGVSVALTGLGFELGRLKTGTPPRLAAETIDFGCLEAQMGDECPLPFSDRTSLDGFPLLPQRLCYITDTHGVIHEHIRSNLGRAPMYNGQIEVAGPRYCPSIEDKVVRFADKASHHIFLEPESLDTNEVYCNGISTSLPADVQDFIVRHLPGCGDARVLRYGYAVEYDVVWPHQIDVTGMTKRVDGLFLAGQINGTSGYEEAAGQGLIAGINAVRYARGQSLVHLGREQAYIGVMMDDLVTKVPREPYRMFTSRAEYRLSLRADNAADRLTAVGRGWGVVSDGHWGDYREGVAAREGLRGHLGSRVVEGQRLIDLVQRHAIDERALHELLRADGMAESMRDRRVVTSVLAEVGYAGYLGRQRREVEKLQELERVPLPSGYDFQRVTGLRNEAVTALSRFRPTTLGQAGRLAGVTPADLMLISVMLRR
jgi:tRNA uridine 5-carboxymethylaminomethyl modification enzyme